MMRSIKYHIITGWTWGGWYRGFRCGKSITTRDFSFTWWVVSILKTISVLPFKLLSSSAPSDDAQQQQHILCCNGLNFGPRRMYVRARIYDRNKLSKGKHPHHLPQRNDAIIVYNADNLYKWVYKGKRNWNTVYSTSINFIPFYLEHYNPP